MIEYLYPTGPEDAFCVPLGHVWDSLCAPACTLLRQHDRLFPAQQLTPECRDAWRRPQRLQNTVLLAESCMIRSCARSAFVGADSAFGRTEAKTVFTKSPCAGITGAPGWNRTSDTRFR